MKSLTNSKYYPWVVVALLGGVALLNYMDRQMLSTMKTPCSGYHGLTICDEFWTIDGHIPLDIMVDEPDFRHYCGQPEP